jgi:hypothetical protein
MLLYTQTFTFVILCYRIGLFTDGVSAAFSRNVYEYSVERKWKMTNDE